MTAPSPLFVAPLLGFSFPLASAIAATSTPSIANAANDPATTQGAAAVLRGDALTVAAAVHASVPVVMQEQ